MTENLYPITTKAIREALHQHVGAPIEGREKGSKVQHILWMCDQMESEQFDILKQSRWIGWMLAGMENLMRFVTVPENEPAIPNWTNQHSQDLIHQDMTANTWERNIICPGCGTPQVNGSTGHTIGCPAPFAGIFDAFSTRAIPTEAPMLNDAISGERKCSSCRGENGNHYVGCGIHR